MWSTQAISERRQPSDTGFTDPADRNLGNPCEQYSPRNMPSNERITFQYRQNPAKRLRSTPPNYSIVPRQPGLRCVVCRDRAVHRKQIKVGTVARKAPGSQRKRSCRNLTSLAPVRTQPPAVARYNSDTLASRLPPKYDTRCCAAAVSEMARIEPHPTKRKTDNPRRPRGTGPKRPWRDGPGHRDNCKAACLDCLTHVL